MGVYLIDVYLTGVYLTGVHFMNMYFTGVHLMGVYLMGVHLIGVYLMACTSWACTSQACISWRTYHTSLTGMHLSQARISQACFRGRPYLSRHARIVSPADKPSNCLSVHPEIALKVVIQTGDSEVRWIINVEARRP
jgi:hypothetical protein